MNLKVHKRMMYPGRIPGKCLRTAVRAMKLCARERSGHLFRADLLITDDAGIQDMNFRYRKVNRATDVLAFPMAEWNGDLLSECKGGMRPGSRRVFLGDIVLSWDRILKQAEEYGHSAERETAFLACHGMLHLLGFDHRNQSEEEWMNEKQEEILIRAGIPL